MALEGETARPETRLATALRARGVRFWFLGAGFGLLYQVPTLVDLWSSSETLGLKLYGTVLLAMVYATFLLLPPFLWGSTRRVKWMSISGFALLTIALFPALHAQIVWIWILVVAVAAVVLESPREFFPLLAAFLLAMQVVIFLTDGEPYLYLCLLVTPSLGVVMFIMNRQLVTVRSLRAANAEIARLAVVEERARFSRDLHDVLGHSLTVVTVKSELATKLIDRDPDGARDELADIERLSREALRDLRAAVSNYRDVSLGTELASARTALTAAGIEAALPTTTSGIQHDRATFFAWVLREAVTNVIRHSGARHCVVDLQPDRLIVTDDGVGAASGGGGGNGLRGLRERARSIGAIITAGSTAGGFRVEARMPDA